jgi:hypothetical protein
MSLITRNGKILSASGKLVTKEDCCCPRILYIQFKVISHEYCGDGFFPYFRIGGNAMGDPSVAVYRYNLYSPTNSGFLFIGHTGSRDAGIGSFAPEVWYTVDLQVDFSESFPVVTPRINGAALAPFNCESGLAITRFYLGACQSIGSFSYVNNRQLDDLKIGTQGWGSDNLFSADFSSGVVPPFDSIVGLGASLSAGTLLVLNGFDCEGITQNPPCSDPIWAQRCAGTIVCPDPPLPCAPRGPCSDWCDGSSAYAQKDFTFP